jgi:hypothetical protein
MPELEEVIAEVARILELGGRLVESVHEIASDAGFMPAGGA